MQPSSLIYVYVMHFINTYIMDEYWILWTGWNKDFALIISFPLPSVKFTIPLSALAHHHYNGLHSFTLNSGSRLDFVIGVKLLIAM